MNNNYCNNICIILMYVYRQCLYVDVLLIWLKCRILYIFLFHYVQACVGQLFVSCLCWILCSQWLPRNILLAALFTSTHKSVGLGSWVLRGAYHGSAHGPAVNLPLSILPVAQLLLGSLLAGWLSP